MCPIAFCTVPNPSMNIDRSLTPTSMEIYIAFIYFFQDGCLFNGQVYQENQAFDDGCTRSCVCMNATSGQYSCRQK